MSEEKYVINRPQELEHLENEGVILSPLDQYRGLVGLTEKIDDSYLLRIFSIRRYSEEDLFQLETEVTSFVAKERSLTSLMFQQVTNMSALQYLLMVNEQQLTEFEKELQQHWTYKTPSNDEVKYFSSYRIYDTHEDTWN